MGLRPTDQNENGPRLPSPNDSEWVFVRFVTHSLALGVRLQYPSHACSHRG